MKPALLVVDMQNDLCRDKRRRQVVERMIPALKELIDEFSNRSLPVFYAYFALPADDSQFIRFGDRYCVEGTEGAEIIRELQPLRGPVIRKQKHSAFYETELDSSLRSAAVCDLYIAGLQTQICIMTTAADASFRGYRPVVVRECVASSRPKSKEMALDWIAKYVGDVISLADVNRELGGTPR